MKILVTGAAGLIGSELSSRLFEIGHEVWCIDDMSRGTKIPNCSKWICGDVSDFSVIETLPFDFDFIFHLAAVNGTTNFYLNPNQVLSNNIRCDLSIFEYAKKCLNLKKIIYSSSSEISTHEEFCVESNTVLFDDISNPRWSYKIAKTASENYLHNSNLPWVILRYFNVYGEETKSGHVVFDQIEQHKRGVYKIIGKDESRCYTYVSDAIDATIICVNKCKMKEVINIGSEEELTSLQVAEIIAKNLGIFNVKYSFIDGRKGSPIKRKPDIKKMLIYYPDYSPITFDEGIKKIIDSSDHNFQIH